MVQEEGALMSILDWVLDVEPSALIAYVKAEREKYPNLDSVTFAKKEFSRARWKAVGSGVATGIPANIWVSVPAATADIAYVLKREIVAVARCAVFFDEHFFDDTDARWELLVPIFGIDITSQFLREAGIRGAMGATRVTIKKVLTKGTLEAFKKFMLKYFGIKVTQKGLITKTIPIVGAVVGGLWNYVEVGLVRDRTISYFTDNFGSATEPAGA